MPPTFTLDGATVQHPLELKFNTSGWDILSAIEMGFRAQGDVKGKLAEWFLFKDLVVLKENGVIDDLIWYEKDGKPDFDIVVGSRRIKLECKNARSKNPSQEFARIFPGYFEVELQKTRHQLVGNKKLRSYKVTSWDILAVCLFNKTGTWTYLYVETARLERDPDVPEYLVVMQPVPPSPGGVWKGTLAEVLKELAPEINA